MLLVDHREGSIDLLEPLRKIGLPAEKGINIPADLMWEGRGEGGKPIMIGVEFKKVGELVDAMRTERLQGSQLLTMRKNFDVCYLLIEGEILHDSKGQLLRRAGRREFRPMAGGMSIGELYKRLHVLHLRGGLNQLRSHSRQDTLAQIAACYRVWTDCDLDQHNSHIAIYQAPTLAPISEFRGFVSRFEGVGIRKSLAVETYFKGKLRRACTAGPAEWMKIDGIGKEIAQHVEAVLEGTTYRKRRGA